MNAFLGAQTSLSVIGLVWVGNWKNLAQMVPPVYEQLSSHILCELCCKVDSVCFSLLVGYALINIIDLLNWYARFTELWISFDNYIV